jgi:acetyl esterase/lipase
MPTSESTDGRAETPPGLFDPEMAAVIGEAPVMSLSDLPAVRAALVAAPGAPGDPRVRHEDRRVPGLDGRPDVLVRIYRPAEPGSHPRPAVYWIHGGGFVMGHIGRDDAILDRVVARTGCVAVAVEWRQAPEHPYPASLDDAEGGYRWMRAHAADIGADSERIIIAGASSGGGTAAGLALRLRDTDELAAVPLLLLVYPMLDDRDATPSSARITDPRLWHREVNRRAWQAYVGHLAEVPPYAAPARADDLGGFPPTWIGVGDLDLFVDEDIRFAQTLMASRVPVELHVYPGAIHGFFARLPGSAQAARFADDMDDAITRAIAGAWPHGLRKDSRDD